MDKIFNFLSISFFVIIIVFLFYFLFNRQNNKYLIPLFFIILVTFIIDLINIYSFEFVFITILLYFLFIFAILFFTKYNFKGTGTNYEINLSFLIKLFFIYYLILVFKTAWISDDAYITFRVADNFVNGYGLRWNTEERVQVFTNTLFLFAFIPFYFIFRDVYFVSLFLNILFAVATILLLKKITTSKEKFLVLIAGFCFSKAYIDFSTSGLENSLTFFLFALFLYVYYKFKDANKKGLYISLIFSGLFLNRPDAILIILPMILFMLFRGKLSYKFVFYGLTPLFVWEIFSIIYYGFPLPNTFYAKLNTGIRQSDLIKQGGLYFLNSLLIDPITLFVIFSALILNLISLLNKEKNIFSFISIGIILYLLYVLYIGGDFMSGRFFACCIPFSLFALSNLIKGQKIVFVFLFFFIFLYLNSPFYSIYNFNVENKIIAEYPVQIISEREFYYPVTGLLNVLAKGKKVIDESGYAKDAKRIRNSNKQQRQTGMSIAIGILGFYAGPEVYIIDQASIADAFTARLPVSQRWRIGHFAREWPEGYEKTLRHGVNLIKEKKLSEFYDKISLITKGKIFDRERFKAILEVNFGKGIYGAG